MVEARRKMAAIPSAGVAGCSRLMDHDAAATVETPTKFREPRPRGVGCPGYLLRIFM